MTIISFFYAEAFYNVFFNICLGMFIGGIIFSAISFFLAQMESSLSGEGEIDIDTDVDAELDADVDAELDVDAEADTDTEIDEDISDITPAPIMLLLSASFLIYGISGIIFYYLLSTPIKFIIFFATPTLVYISWKAINNSWKKIAKSRYYTISSTENLIGRKGEVLLGVDHRGGIIKIPSQTPMRFERLHVKSLIPELRFERGENVYICDVKNGFLLVDDKKNLIKKRRY